MPRPLRLHVPRAGYHSSVEGTVVFPLRSPPVAAAHTKCLGAREKRVSFLEIVRNAIGN